MTNWYTINKDFEKKYPDYAVVVVPLSLSEQKNKSDTLWAKAVALGKAHSKLVFIDHNEKTVTYYK